jgi:hypothetical protein
MNRSYQRFARTSGGYLVCIIAVAMAAGCGGSSADSSTAAAVSPASSVTTPPPQAPTISGTPPATATVGVLYSFQPSASGPTGDTLTFSISNKPSWATFDATSGLLSGKPTSSDVGTSAAITISVSDGTLSAQLNSFQIQVSNASSTPPNQPPTISGTPATTVQAGASYSFQPSASDPNGNTLTFSIVNQPSWATFSTSTGKLTGKPTSGNVGTTSGIVISVSDGSTSVSLAAFAITVTAPPPSPPTISGSPQAVVIVGSAYSFTPTATDAAGLKLTFSIQNLPAWASFNTSTGALTGTPGSSNVGSYSNIIISVSDGTLSASLAAFSITVNASVPPPPPPTGAAVLDDFSEGMRTMGGHNLWDVYTGEGAAGSTSVSASAAHFTTQGLDYHTTGGPAYMHFFSNDGTDWHFAHEEITSGSWSNSYNRMSFWVFMPTGMVPETGGDHDVELGTYTRCATCDTTTQNAGGNHWYHEYNPLAGVWTYVIVDDHPQHYVGGPSTDPGVVCASGCANPATTDGTSNYMTALTRFYWNDVDTSKSYPADVYFDQFQFYTEANVGDVAHIASLEASYNPATHLLHVGFARNASEDSTADTTYTAVWSTQDINTVGFAAATPLGSVGPDGVGDYVMKKIEATVDLTGVSTAYIAVQKQGSSTFREIPLRIN